jgi:hypothetical protein
MRMPAGLEVTAVLIERFIVKEGDTWRVERALRRAFMKRMRELPPHQSIAILGTRLWFDFDSPLS